MTNNFRALCADLADAYLRTLEHINNSTWLGYEPSDDPLLLRARAALADEPAAPTPPADGEVAGLVADLQQQANHGFSDLTRNLLISLASHMAYMQGQLQARHDPDEDDLEDCYWYAESVALRQMVSDALAGKPAPLLPLADTHYEWELEDAKGEWQAGGSSNSQSDVEREGMRYLQTYTQDGPHKLIIRQHTTQTINEITNG